MQLNSEKVRYKKGEEKPNMKPCWIKRIEGDIKIVRKCLVILEREKKSEMRKRAKIDQLERKYQVKKNKLNTVTEELNQRLAAKTEREINNKNNCLSKNRRNSRTEWSN